MAEPTSSSVPPSSFDRDPIDRLADSFVARFRAGERPSVEEYAAKYPELADEIRELLPALVALELGGSPMGSATGEVFRPPVEPGEPPQQLGDYLILREIGRGGMGVVYEAVQQSLGRHVALKVLPRQSLGDSAHLERFRLEARAAARLHHTNIVPVFGVGDQEGTHYYAMQFIQGQGLDEVFEELRRLRGAHHSPRGAGPGRPGPVAADRPLTQVVTCGLLTGKFADPAAEPVDTKGTRTEGVMTPPPPSRGADEVRGPGDGPRSGLHGGSGVSSHSELSGSQAENQYYRSVARVGLQVAEALAYAHSQGIVHRDIKPSNLLLDARGAVWVTDFGLAKSEGSDALTHTGDIVGTLRYMAPERFDGWSDPRSDVYSLGATLYELLTLRYLFQEPNRARLIDRVVHDAPAPPRKLDRKIPRDLETIILKAIAKEPGRRYASAEQMAEDLRRFLADKPVLARRISPSEQAWRWCRRNRALATTGALAFLSLVGAVVALEISNVRISASSRALETALRDRGDALRAARESEARARLSAAEADNQRTRAEAGEAQARGAVDEFLNKVTEDQLLKTPGLHGLRRDLLRSALRFYEGFLEQRGDDPNLRAALAGVHLHVGQIQQDLGDGPSSRQSYLAARKLYEGLLKARPDDPAFRDGLATCLFQTGNNAEAAAIWEQLLKADSANPRYRNSLGDAYNSLAIRQGNEKKLAEQLQSNQKARELREGLVRDFPEAPEYRGDLGSTLNNIGVILNQQGHHQDALAMFLRAVEHEEAAFSKAPHDLAVGRFLGTCCSNVANTMRAVGRREEAERWFGKTLDHYRRLSRDNPAVPSFHASFFKASYDLGRFLLDQGRLANSKEPFRMAAEALRGLPRSTPGDLYNLACVQARVAAALGPAHGTPAPEEKAEAAHLADSALETLRKAIDAGLTETAEHIRNDEDLATISARPEFQALVARVKAAEVARSVASPEMTGPAEKRLAAQRQALEARSKLAAQAPDNRRYRADQAASQYSIGQLLSDLGRHSEAEKELKAALAIREKLAREEPLNLRYKLDAAQIRVVLGHVAWKAGRLADADRAWNEGLSALREALKDEPEGGAMQNELDTARAEVAGRMFQLGLTEEPGKLLHQVFRRSPSDQVTLTVWNLGHEHAMLRVLAGDLTGFRASCAELFRRSHDEANKFNLYRACLAGPEPLPPGDLEFLIDAAEKDLEKHPKENWFLLFPAMLHERAGHHAKALEFLDRVRPGNAWAIHLGAARAIVLHRLGRGDEARRTLAEADADLAHEYQGALGGDSPRVLVYPETIALREVLRREAHALVDGKSAPDDPYRLLLRARVLGKMGRVKDSETALASAMAIVREDSRDIAAYALVLGELDLVNKGHAIGPRAMELLDQALASRPDDIHLRRTRALFLASRGDWGKAEAELARTFAGQKGGKSRWLVAGTWVVGPYPFDPKRPGPSMAVAHPPEHNPDPFRPVADADGKSMLAWRPVSPGDDGFLDLAPLVQPKDRVSTYVQTRVYAPEERDLAVLVNNDDDLRLWCNGELIRAQPFLNDASAPTRLRLRAGWNTLLAKVTNWEGPYSLKLELTDDLEKIARAFGDYARKEGWSEQKGALLERLIALVPYRHGPWDNAAEPLAAEVARRVEVFRRVIAERPEDSLLWQERGRYLAWLEKWSWALAAYDRMIHDHPDPDDCFVEYAALLLLEGKPEACKALCKKIVERFGSIARPFTRSMVVRLCALTSDLPVDPAQLIAWAEWPVAREPHSAYHLHGLGLAHLRAGHFDQAERHLKASMDAGEDSPRNWYATALAYARAGRTDQAAPWLQKAEDWMGRKESEFAASTTHPAPPMPTVEWLETLLLCNEARSLIGKVWMGNILLKDQSLPAGQPLRLTIGPVTAPRDRAAVTALGAFRLIAPFRTRSPVADGKIDPDEYGPPLAIDFTDDANPGRIAFGPKNPARNADDLSAELSLACTKTDLFVAVRVKDDILIATEDRNPIFRDRVELFIDGDRQPGDLLPEKPGGSAEGFQACTDALGRKFAVGIGTSDDDYVVATSTFKGGYIAEFRVPLRNIDIDDGVEVTPARPGTALRFNLAIHDNDEPVDSHRRYVQLWHIDAAPSAYLGGDGPHWPVDLHLARPVRYELVDGPKGATIDPETGRFEWQTPGEPGKTRITVRVRDPEGPGAGEEGSFLVTTTPAVK